jgi:photosystem II stability/assembly factor-like uncharacterized protein
MKQLTIIFVLLSYNLFSQSNWTLINANTTKKLTDINLVSNYGYVVGDSGTILKTINYGSTWTNISIPITDNIKSVSFVNDSVGYFSTPQSIFKTNNFGTTWSSIYTSTNTINVIYFLNNTVGFIGTENKILKTIDGGITWANQQNTTSEITAISFPTQSVGFFTGGNDASTQLYKTTNQGNSFINYPVSFQTIKEDIFFINNNEGFITGWYSPSVLKTIDGGLTWNIIDTQNAGSFSISSLTSKIAYKVDNQGGNSIISSTINGGVTWTDELVLPTGKTYGLKKIRSIGNYIIAIGYNGMIYKKQSSLSIEGVEQILGITIYPNPSHNEINVDIQIPHTNVEIEVLDMNGKSIIKQNKNWDKINFSHLANGIYLLTINIDNKLLTRKIVKQ